MPCCAPATDWTYGSGACGTCGGSHMYCKFCGSLIGHCSSQRKKAAGFVPMQRAVTDVPATVRS